MSSSFGDIFALVYHGVSPGTRQELLTEITAFFKDITVWNPTPLLLAPQRTSLRITAWSAQNESVWSAKLRMHIYGESRSLYYAFIVCV